tara:strand:- start:538 stop:639 length:102 start_codon:yes stop_codon:yes gene_type:complete
MNLSWINLEFKAIKHGTLFSGGLYIDGEVVDRK